MIKTIFYTNYLAVLSLTIILLVMTLIAINLNIKIKIVAILIILFFYYTNLRLFSFYIFIIIKYGYITKVDSRNDNTVLQELSYYIFNKTFRLCLDFEKMPCKPSLIVCNYCYDRLENFAAMLIPGNVVILIRDVVLKYTKLDKVLKWIIVVKKEDSYENTRKEIAKHINEGRSVLSYITKDPYFGPTDVRGIRSGIFKISKELNVPITPITLDYIDSNYGLIKYQNFTVKAGDTFFVEDIKDAMTTVKKFFKSSLTNFKKYKYRGII